MLHGGSRQRPAASEQPRWTVVLALRLSEFRNSSEEKLIEDLKVTLAKLTKVVQSLPHFLGVVLQFCHVAAHHLCMLPCGRTYTNQTHKVSLVNIAHEHRFI